LLGSLKGQDVLTVEDLGREGVLLVLDATEAHEDAWRAGDLGDLLAGRALAPMFYGSDAWGRASFERAMVRLGGHVLSMRGLADSRREGGLAGAARAASACADVIVHAHPEVFSAHEAAKGARVPLINGGDGTYEDPTQALADLFTLSKEHGAIDGLTITLVGDLRHSRFVHSLVRGLAHWDVSLRLISPPGLKLASVLAVPLRRAVEVAEVEDLAEALDGSDIVYVAPIEVGAFPRPKEAASAQAWLTDQVSALDRAPASVGVMCPDPAPGWAEGATGEMVEGPFRQAVNGVWVRAVVLGLVLGALPRS
jgi:aspartate carbamoyltransferase catalytic subunit